jgi:dCTP diphosphatase
MNELSNIENKDPQAGNLKQSITEDNLKYKATKLKVEPVLSDSVQSPIEEFKFSESPTLEQLRSIQSKFVSDRNWNQFQTPRNLLLAMVAEVGELSEIFQWKGEVQQGLPGWSAEDRTHLEQELSDVFIYLMRLAEECRVDLPRVAAAKIEANSRKYPVEKFYGTSKKYNQE